MKNPEILHELPPLSSEDCLYVIERKKTEFTFPVHVHKEFELNYIENAPEAQRIVGDSIEETGDLDLVLITGEHLEHAWQNHKCTSNLIREITIQFSPTLLSSELLNKKQFVSIKKMFDDAQRGLAFSLDRILKIRSLLNSLTCESNGFYSVVTFLSLLNELSVSGDYKILSSSAFAKSNISKGSNRIKQVDVFLQENYHREIKLKEVADLAHMTPVAFSRFFKLRSGKNFTDYLADIRVGIVTRMLVDSNKTIAEICYECGFNNISNFNRIFKQRKGCSPREFREVYKKKRIVF